MFPLVGKRQVEGYSEQGRNGREKKRRATA